MPMTQLQQRLAAGAFPLFATIWGVTSLFQTTAARASEVSELLSRETGVVVAQADAVSRELNFKKSRGYFEAELEADFERFGVRPISIEDLKQPNRFEHLVQKGQVLKVGKSFKSNILTVKVGVQKVAYNSGGATVRAAHTVATIKNVSDTAVAYYAKLSSASRGTCEVRGTRMHNVMALLPGESAEVTICAGKTSAQLEDLRAMSLTPLGYYYVSKLPPAAVGHDIATAHSHRPPKGVDACSRVPAVRIASALRADFREWEDVVDFYSRHNCDRIDYVMGYERSENPLAELPAVGDPEDRAAAAQEEIKEVQKVPDVP